MMEIMEMKKSGWIWDMFWKLSKKTCCLDVDKEKGESNICHHFPVRLTQFFCP